MASTQIEEKVNAEIFKLAHVRFETKPDAGVLFDLKHVQRVISHLRGKSVEQTAKYFQREQNSVLNGKRVYSLHSALYRNGKESRTVSFEEFMNSGCPIVL